MKPPKLTDQQKREVMRLRATRKTFKEIARMLGCTHRQVQRVVNLLTIPDFRKRRQVAARRHRKTAAMASREARRRRQMERDVIESNRQLKVEIDEAKRHPGNPFKKGDLVF